MEVSIIIVNYNTVELTTDCLNSIYEYCQDVEFEVIVVDNASKDNSCEQIRRLFPMVQLIESDKNLGFGRANNLGACHASGKYLFFLNSDTVLLNNAVAHFYQFFESGTHLDMGAAGAVLYDSNLKPMHSFARFPTVFSSVKIQLWGIFLKRLGVPIEKAPRLTPGNYPKVVDYVTGADLFMPKAVFQTYNGFDERFFMYFEETDLQRRMHMDGLTSVVIDGPKIIHLLGGSNKGKPGSFGSLQIFLESELLYLRTHTKKPLYSVYKYLYMLLKVPFIVYTKADRKDKIKYLRTIARS